MISFPKAKVNLGLRITRKRVDGYHDIESIFYPIGLSDALEFKVDPKAKTDELTVTGLSIPKSTTDNLVVLAVKLLRKRFDIPYLKIHLHKAIPCGGGLGGGSSDASYMLKSLNKFFNFGLDVDELKEISLDIGSDCPFFIEAEPALAMRRGEDLTPMPPFLEGMYIVILHPHINISTKEAYQNCFPHEHEQSLPDLVKNRPNDWKSLIFNDFEDYVFSRHPEIGELKKYLYNSGAIFSSMTGSGAAVYGIFGHKPSISQSIHRYLIYQGEL
jgi:4-diphosphocytidyl-2-C-methyl-D-erythritol kinase